MSDSFNSKILLIKKKTSDMQKGNYVYIHTHSHTLTHLYIYIYLCIYKCLCV